MKREIKFRAWIPESYDDDDNPHYAMTYDLAFEDYEPINDLLNQVEHLMQFTGLKDKNGKEIYEGDIVKKQVHSVNGEYVPYPKVAYKNYVIEWWIGYTYGYRMKNKRNIMHLTPSYGRDSEVIGNIYENPELL